MSISNQELFLDVLDDLFFAFDNTRALIEWNQKTQEVTGYTDEELREMELGDFFTGMDKQEIESSLVTLAETGDSVVEVDLHTADGTAIPYEFKSQKIEDSNTIDFIGIGRDISHRRQREQERNAILNRMGDGFFALDQDWEITYINNTGEEILGQVMDRDPDETTFEGLQIWEEIPDAEELTSYEKYHQAVQTGEQQSFEVYSLGIDKWLDVRVFPSRTGLSVYFHDITEQRKQNEQIKHREKTLQQLYRIIANREKTFSEQVQELLAFGRAELGTGYGALAEIDGEDYIFEVVDTVDGSIKPGDTVPLSSTFCELAVDEQETIVLGDIARDAPDETHRAGFTEGGVACYIGAPVIVNDDVYGAFCFYDTDPRKEQFSDWEVALVDLMSRWVSYELQRKQTTEELARQNERLEKFASMVSHDLRNPLGVAMGSIEIARETDSEEHFEKVENALGRIDDLIDDMLSLAQSGETVGDFETIYLDAVGNQSWEHISVGESELNLEASEIIRGDETRVQQLLENLFRNAIEHNEEGVTITVGELSDGFYVEDDGDGIPDDVHEKVFESGFTTIRDGTGFGLAIVSEISKAHGWNVQLTDSEEGGARFEFTGLLKQDNFA